MNRKMLAATAFGFLMGLKWADKNSLLHFPDTVWKMVSYPGLNVKAKREVFERVRVDYAEGRIPPMGLSLLSDYMIMEYRNHPEHV